jgi:hypothetical protein
MRELEIRNAIIKAATLTNADHGCLTAWIHLDYGGMGQGFGGLALYLPKSYAHHAKHGIAGHFIWRVMEVAGVSDWSQLVGSPVRTKSNNAKVQAIGHIIKDDWFDPSEDFKEL